MLESACLAKKKGMPGNVETSRPVRRLHLKNCNSSRNATIYNASSILIIVFTVPETSGSDLAFQRYATDCSMHSFVKVEWPHVACDEGVR